MDIIVTHVYDKERFIHYVRLKFRIRKSTALYLPNDINEGCYIKLTGIPECDVRYLQRPNLQYTEHFCATNKPICDLKILNNKVINLSKMPLKRKPNIPPYLDNEKTSCIDVSPQPGDEPKQEPLELFHVKFTKVIHFVEMLNERQIQALLKDKHVKSINIDK